MGPWTACLLLLQVKPGIKQHKPRYSGAKMITELLSWTHNESPLSQSPRLSRNLLIVTVASQAPMDQIQE